MLVNLCVRTKVWGSSEGKKTPAVFQCFTNKLLLTFGNLLYIGVMINNLIPTNHSKNEICDALYNLVSFVQFKKREKHPWRSVTFSKVTG